MAQPQVFLSHSSKDAIFTARLEADLQAAGAKVHRVSAQDGGNFQKRIDEALLACQWVVLVLTKDALASSWVEQEIYAANRLKHNGRIKEILPVQAGSVDRKTIPPLWGVYNIFDATRDYVGAKDGVLRAIGLPIGAKPPRPQDVAAVLLAIGMGLVAEKQPAEAIPLFEHVIQLDPSGFDAWAYLGSIYATVQRWQDAIDAYDRALAQNEKQARVWAAKAAVLLALHRYQDVLVASDQALTLDDRQAQVWYVKGKALLLLERYSEALTSLDRSLALEPNDAGAWSNKGNALAGLNRNDEALVAYDRALTLDPNDETTWNDRGISLENLERYSEAILAYDKAIAINPKYADAWANKVDALRALGRTAEAVEAERRAKSLGK